VIRAGRLLQALAAAAALCLPALPAGAQGFPPEQPGQALSAPSGAPELSGLRSKAPEQPWPPNQPAKSHMAEAVFDIDMAVETQAVAAKREQYLSAGGKAWIQAVLRRGRPYMPYIAERIAYYGLPYELIYLPVVESEYNPKVVSRSGAAGIWQFMKNSIGGTAARIDDWRDDRRDFMKSTEAALKKLKYNYEYFRDWYLAIGAYNCGVGAMNAAIKKGGSRDFWTLSDKGALKKETKAYVPKFLAIASIARYAGRNGLDMDWDEPMAWETVELERSVDVTLLADKGNIPLDLLRLGNAELRYNVTPPSGKGYALKVPARYAQAARDVLSDPSLKLLKYHMYAVKSGDTLSALSRHYGVSIDMIVQANPGTKPNSLQIGAKLVIPALKDVSPYEGAKAADSGAPFPGSYTVRKGDSLWSISLKYGVQPEILAERNGLTLSSIIREGMALKVPIIN
jgi:membrane-bound lytic murein transglycosylase D